MIVPAMNTFEILNEALLDLSSVLRKSNVDLKNARRAAIKSKTKTFYKCMEYKSPRKNDWVVIVKATPSISSIIYAVYYLNKQGVNILAVNLKGSYYHYSGHFLERYNERFLHQPGLSRLDIFKSYIHHNTISICEELYPEDTDIKRVIIKINEGIAFGTYEENDYYAITDYKTFISNDMVLHFQKRDVNYVMNSYEEFCNEKPALKKMQIL